MITLRKFPSVSGNFFTRCATISFSNYVLYGASYVKSNTENFDVHVDLAPGVVVCGTAYSKEQNNSFVCQYLYEEIYRAELVMTV